MEARRLAILTLLLLVAATGLTEASVLPALLRDPHTTLGQALVLAAWNASPYAVLAAVVRTYPANIGASAVLLVGSGFVAAPSVVTSLTVLTSPRAGGDGQLGLWILFFPVLQWLGVAVVVGIAALANERKERP